MLGKFITFEGVDGSGKTKQAEFLANTLNNNGIKTHLLREPGGTIFGEKIRNVILGTKDISSFTEVLLFFAARNELFEKEILPTISKGEYVICDRFYDSTIVYQGFFKNTDIEKIMNLKNIILGNFEPDLTFVMDINEKLAIERVLKRKSEITSTSEDKFDSIDENYYKTIIEGYKRIADVFSYRTKLIKANKPFNIISENIKRIIEKKFNLNLKESLWFI